MKLLKPGEAVVGARCILEDISGTEYECVIIELRPAPQGTVAARKGTRIVILDRFPGKEFLETALLSLG